MREFIKTVRKMETRNWLSLSGAIIFMWSIAVPLHSLLWTSNRYELSNDTRQLLGPDDVDYAKLMKLENGVYQFNPEALQTAPTAASPSASIGREGSEDKPTMPAYDLDTDPEKGVTIYDPISKLSFGMVPEFKAMAGRQIDNHVVYPLKGLNGQAVYSPKANGLKEDIILHEEQGDELSFSYTLNLPASLEARLREDGSIGVYSGDAALFGNISFGSETDQKKVEEARRNSAKNNLVFTIPAPIIKQSYSQLPPSAHAHFVLEQNNVTVVATGLKKLHYPISIDPTVVVNSASDFANGNNEGNIELDSANNQIKRGALTGGSLGAWSSTNSFTTARRSTSAVAYNGFLYMSGGDSGGGTALSDVQYAPINSNGTLGSWSATTSFSTARFAHSMVAYNGYMYVVGGATAANTGTNNVQVAKINANGSLGSWSSTTVLPTARYLMGTTVSNGYMYITGGYNGGAINQVYYASIKADGTLGSWTSQTGFTTARYGHMAATYNNFLYIYGGTTGTSLADVQYAPINSDGTIGSWATNTSSLLTARYNFSGGIYGGYMYAVAGDNNGSPLNSVEYAAINNNGSVGAFSSSATLATTTEGLAGAFYNGYVYAIGGANSGSGTQTFSYTGGAQTYNVPAGATSVTIEAWGAQGGCGAGPNGSSCSFGSTPGLGGYAKGTVSVTPGSTLNVYVGGQGGAGTTCSAGGGGYNGGGNSVFNGSCGNGYGGGGGGGASDVRIGGTALANRVMVGAGGGGTVSDDRNDGYNSSGGAGGPSTGGAGQNVVDGWGNTMVGGGGGTQSSGGAGGTGGSAGGAGSLGQGGAVASCGSCLSGGGGGGGYYGGGAGTTALWSAAGAYSAGGGGSNYVTGSSTVSTGGVRSGNGQVTISYSFSTTTSGSYYAKIDGPGTLGSFKSATGLGTGRSIAATVAYNGYIYMMGGWDTGYSSAVQYAQINSNGSLGAWSTTTSLPVAAYSPSGFAANGYMYFGGGQSSGGFQNGVYYAPINANGTLGSWTATTSFTTGRRGVSMTSYNGYAYVAAGDTGGVNVTADVQYAPINANGTLGTWTATTAYATARSNAALVAYAGYMYIYGGSTDNAGNSLNNVQYAPINANGTLGGWTATTSMNTQRGGIYGVVWNGYLYAYGGLSNGSTYHASSEYAKINANGTVGSWTTTSSFTTGRYGHGSVAYNGHAYVVGGYTGSSVADVQYAQVNNGGPGTTTSWGSAGSNFTTGRYAHGTAVLNGYLYVMGGLNPTSGSQTYNYTGGTQSYSVPAGVTTVTIECWGASGGAAWMATNTMSTRSNGGYAKSVISVTPGESLQVVVGGQGGDGNQYTGSYYAGAGGGYNGGGSGGSANVNGGGGGGASDVRKGGTGLGNRICVGGGGGGQAGWAYQTGGTGGGTNGGNGSANGVPVPATPGYGGSQGGGGAGGTSPNGGSGSAGSLGQGGNGGIGGGNWEGGGGGGGGYYGGGGGAGGDSSGQNASSGGGGGSGYATGVGSVLTNGLRAGHGQVTISYTTTNQMNDVQYAPINANGTIGSWTTASNALWSTRYGIQTVAYNGYIYVLGGNNGTSYLNETWYAKQGTNGALLADAGCGAQWCSTSAFTTPRSGFVAGAHNGNLYLAGGYDGTTLSDVQYAPINANGTLGSWTATTGLPAARNSAGGTIYNGYIYVAGGYDGTNYVNTVYYAPINSNGTVGSWSTTTSTHVGRFGNALTAYNGYMYQYGGSASPIYSDVQYAPINANGTLGNWTHAPSMSATRTYISAVSHNGYIYAVGGCPASGCANNLNTVEYTALNSIPRKAKYSKLIDLGALVAPTKLTARYSSPANGVSLSYRYADSSTNVFGSANTVSVASGVYSNAQAAYTRYVWLQVTVDDSSAAVFGDTNQSAVSGFEMFYNAVSTSSSQPRLRGGKLLQEGNVSGLNAQPN